MCCGRSVLVLLLLRNLKFVTQGQAVHKNMVLDVLKPAAHVESITFELVKGSTERECKTKVLLRRRPLRRGRGRRRRCSRSSCLTLAPAPVRPKRDIAHGLRRRHRRWPGNTRRS